MSQYVQLQTHSHYSFLRALPKIPELVQQAKAYNLEALALTDAGNLHGAVSFYKECKKHDIKPIIGLHAYIAPGNLGDPHDREHALARILLYAKDNTGYKNLMKLVTDSFLEGFWERPRIDHATMKKYAAGLIAILPAHESEVTQLIKQGDMEGAAALMSTYHDIFPNSLYQEITHHPEVDGHKERMEGLKTIASQTNTPLVAGQEIYYLKPEDKEAREVLMRIREGRHATSQDSAIDLSFRNPKDTIKAFKDIPEAIENTKKIADQVHVELELGSWVFPDFPKENGESYEDTLKKRVTEGLKERGLDPEDKETKERAEYELEVINTKGFAPYFLVVSDLLTYAKDNGILTTTRGSAAGSLVAYATGITNIDPLFFKLPFERFLNPERPKAPDIDMDFADARRDEVIQYAREKYGDDKVAQIGTFGTMMARAAVRDTARALGHSYNVGDRIAKLIPMGSQGFPMTITKAMELEPELKDLYKGDEDVKEIIDLAKKIEGCARQTGVHAAGVVISPTTLTDWTPVQRDPKGGKLITQYDMHEVEDAGLLKFDFLGIKNLSILADAVQRAKEETGDEIDIENIPLDDQKTFDMLARGETEGLFQLNGSGMTRFLKELEPTTIHDINTMVALYRPGPMESIPSYIERKHHPKKITYYDPRMEEILEQSRGVIAYQDDVLLTAINLAGYSWLEADKLRKAMGKKIPEEMEAQREKFISGAIEKGMTEEKAMGLWQLIAPFAGYGFNKCITGDTRIYNPETGEYKCINTLITQNTPPAVAALDNTNTLTSTHARWIRENGIKKVYKLTTRSGRTIRATANHPLKTFDGWKELGKLEHGEYIATPRTLPEPIRTYHPTHHEAAVLGYLIAEGNLCHPSGIYFYSAQEAEIEDFTHNALKFPNAKIHLNRSKRTISAYVGRTVRNKTNSMYAWAQSLNILGKTATEKEVPEVVHQYPNSLLAVFLGKLWQGDGCVSIANTQTYYATSSKKLAEDVQHLLLRFGILSKIYTKKFKYRDELKIGWTVVITGNEHLAMFKETIGQYLLNKKRSDLEILCTLSARRTNNRGRGTVDIVPQKILDTVRRVAQEKNIGVQELARQAGVHERILGYDARRKGYARETVQKLAAVLETPALIKHACNDVFWDEVISITPDGTEMTYDLSVPKLQNFVANDIVVHNSHAASYGKVAYQTAYMKANYPVPYMAALLTADSGDIEKITILVAECTRMKIPVLPPSVNESDTTFTIVEDATKIRFGLDSIKNFGHGIAHHLITERNKNGTFTSIADFLARMAGSGLNRKGLESLIRSGALDELSSRGVLLTNIEELIRFYREANTDAGDQDSLFGTALPEHRLELEEAEEPPLTQKLEWERELLGIYISGHPLDAHEDILKKMSTTISTLKTNARSGVPIALAGMIEDIRPILTKKGDKMAFVRFGDKTGSIECVVFPKLYKEHATILEPSKCLLLQGNLSNRNGEVSIIIDKLRRL